MSRQATAELIQPLSAEEQHHRGELLGAIRETLFNSGMTIGFYLNEIRRKRLFRDYPGATDAERWATFVADKLPIKVKRTYQLMRAFQVLRILQEANITPEPTREAHIRPLCPLLKDKKAGSGLIVAVARNVIEQGGWTEDIVKKLASTKQPRRISTKVEKPDDDEAEIAEKPERTRSAPLRLLNAEESHEVSPNKPWPIGSANGNNDDNPDDIYCTPLDAIGDICEFETWAGVILDPAANDGRIMRVALEADKETNFITKFISQDIRTTDIGEGVEGGVDFLTTTQRVDGIIANPPWTKMKDREISTGVKPRADLFVAHAKKIARKKVAMLLPLSFLAGCDHFPLVCDEKYPVTTVYVYVKRLSFQNQDNCPFPVCWIVWEKGYKGHPEIRWINNQEEKK